jgi:uncharacterized membrane protein YdjX (TVP38/TMEM64 family)
MLKKVKSYIGKGLLYIYEHRAFIVLGIIAVFLAAAAYEYYSEYFDILKNPKKVKDIILSYKQYSIFAFLALQIIQVVAFFIPGEVVQIAGGYIYGAFFGGIITLIGISMGSAIVYSISRVFGKPFIRKIISDRHLDFFDKLLKLGSVNYIVFLLYLIPGIPKDVLAYICGISDITFKNFILYSTVGRIPGIFVSTYFGSRMYGEHKGVLIAIAVLMTVLFIVGVFKGERIIKSLVSKD